MSSLSFEGFLSKKLVALLKALQLRDSSASTQAVLCVPSTEGLKLSTDLHKALQAHLYLPRSVFRTWVWTSRESPSPSPEDNDDDNSDRFILPLAQFTRACELCMPSSTSKLAGDTNGLFRFEWVQGLDSVSLRSQDLNVQTECQLASLASISIPSFPFSHGQNSIMLKLIVKGEFLRAALKFVTDRDRFTVVWESGGRSVVFGCEDQTGSQQIHVSVESPEVESFNADADISFSYSSLFLHGALRTLSMATKTSLRINSLGLLSLQVMIDMASDAVFFEYIVAPVIEVP